MSSSSAVSSLYSTSDTSTFRVSGLISGMSTDDIVSQLMEIAQKPLDRLTAKKTLVTNQLTEWRSLNVRVEALKTQTAKLADKDTFQARTATSSDTDILTVTASDGTNTATQNITVVSLAQSHQIMSQVYESEDNAIGTGTVTISVGAGTFAPITVDSSNNTLKGLKDTINNGNYGVTASVVKAADNQYRLILTSNTSGSNSSVSVDMNLTGGTEPTFTDLQAAQDAHIKLGTGDSAVDVYRSSNTFSDVIDGVTVTLVSANPDKQVSISMSQDTSAVKQLITGMITQFNNLVGFFDTQFTYNEDSKTAGTLFSNTDLMTIKRDIYSAVTDRIGGSGKYHSLTDIGIGVDSTGQLVIEDEDLFSDALNNNTAELEDFLTNEDYGLGVRVNNYLDQLTDSSDGLLAIVEESFNDEITSLEESIELKQESLDALETSYYTKFSNLEAAMAEIQTQSQYLETQFGLMSSSKDDKS